MKINQFFAANALGLLATVTSANAEPSYASQASELRAIKDGSCFTQQGLKGLMDKNKLYPVIMGRFEGQSSEKLVTFISASIGDGQKGFAVEKASNGCFTLRNVQFFARPLANFSATEKFSAVKICTDATQSVCTTDLITKDINQAPTPQ